MADEEGQTIGKTELDLYKAALSNDWEEAEKIFETKGIKYAAKITTREETALHIAALAGHSDFVENLVKGMDENEKNLEMKKWNNQPSNTAFHCAAISGSVKSAEAIKTKNTFQKLATARGNGNFFPIHMAASKGNKEMVRFLYEATESQLKPDDVNNDFSRLLIFLINSDIYDIALKMVKEKLQPHKGTGKLEEEALKELAQKPLNSLGFLDRRIYPLLHKHGVEKSLMNRSAIELVQSLWDSLTSDETKLNQLCESRDGNVILEAAKHGNFEFLSILIASNPHFLFCKDENQYTIFHHAILNRHVEIFKLIHIGSVRTVVTTFRDKEGNNMLHLAGKLAPPNRLNIVPGAALQLQLELLWFEEVKKVMEPHEVNRKISSLQILEEILEKKFQVMEELIDQYKPTNIEATTIAQKLFEKLKKVMEASKVLEEYTQLDKAKFLFEEVKKVMEPHEVNRKISLLQLLEDKFQELKTVMEQHKLKEHAEWTKELAELTKDYATLLLLFKEIETLMGQHELSQEYSPHDVFVKEHKELMAKGEKWLRDTANSCMVVTALITTIAFAAAITLPGGNADDGYPHFLNDRYFKIFAVADTVSLVSSASSLLSFLSILTARYTIDDFRWSLPNKLVIGLVTLFMSVVAMMVAFVMSIFIIFKDSPKLLAAVITMISSLPVWLFLMQHCRLFVDVIYSTYTRWSLFKSRRDPNLLLKEKKEKRKSLFFL